ncbi:hypothetical protein OE749_16290 [Aestuariibacter sp. AA17]|uniref:PQ loop repeat n=1 Tax=Fluctibacter corallii TaxID=2984329 RepID=A0ABT3AC99_9ALTE|nr:hypothetical protein [Aestuariibacter sp. AA17]MCV2886254.1 hypothetical protein [Aestuariibacter sp. AA17]
MTAYTIFGTVNTLLIIGSLIGVFSQLRTIWQRKTHPTGNSSPTALLSLNQFSVSYLAYLSFFIYGYSIEPFNHYIVWPRLIASILVLLILLEIFKDRKTRASRASVGFACIALALGVAGLFIGETFADEGRTVSTIIILVVSILIAQGYFHQIRLIVRSGSTGAVDLTMSQFILMMDISTIAFAFSMGLENGWPLLVLATTSGVTKIIIWYLFHWVKCSHTAEIRRNSMIS